MNIPGILGVTPEPLPTPQVWWQRYTRVPYKQVLLVHNSQEFRARVGTGMDYGCLTEHTEARTSNETRKSIRTDVVEVPVPAPAPTPRYFYKGIPVPQALCHMRI